jgi:type III pantothenate kinase
VAADSLYHSTSQLRRVELDRPSSAIGRNTVHAIQSGLVFGYTDMVKGMVARFDEELGGGCKVIATGGLADFFSKEAGIFDVVLPNLTLSGLQIIHALNS